MIRTARAVAAGGLLAVAACAVQPDDINLRGAFAEQIAAVDGVEDFERDGDELTFSGPDGRGGTGNWRVRIDSAALEPGPDEQRPYQGHVLASRRVSRHRCRAGLLRTLGHRVTRLGLVARTAR